MDYGQILKKRRILPPIMGHLSKESIIIFWHSIDLINFVPSFNQKQYHYYE